MNDYQPDVNQNPQPPIAFCQNCGKSLDLETVRRVGTAVYCEPCLDARVHGTGPASAPPYANVHFGGSAGGQPVINSCAPNPGLAALLGLIPGVGAMYNEQYAKGVVHLGIFAVIITFTHISGIFVLFVFGWIAYMSIEAHHTAKARRDGTPLPNPFGLNDIGERMGFGAAWPSADVKSAARDAVNTAAETINAAASSFNRPPVAPPTAGAAPWGAPTDAYGQPYNQPYSQPFNYANPNPMPPVNAAYAPPYAPVSAAVPPYAPPYAPTPMPPQPARFPVGAVWLIGLGTFFLLSTLGIFRAVSGEALVGTILLLTAFWIFFRRMTEAGGSMSDDGSPGYQIRVVRAIRGSVWVAAIGVLCLLSAFDLLRWNYSWPVLIILAGVMMIAQRFFYNSAAAAASYQTGPIITPPPQTYPAESSGSTKPQDRTEGGL